MYVRSLFALAVAMWGLMASPGVSDAAPEICPPACDGIPGSAWIYPGAIPLAPVYRWPDLAGIAVATTAPRFAFESWCASPRRDADPRDYAVAARAEIINSPGQWSLQVQVVHWRGDTVTGGRDALETLEWARMALSACQLTAPAVSPSLTTSEAMQFAAVVSGAGRVMRTYLVVDPASSTLVEMTLWSTTPPAVPWRGGPADAEVFDAMAVPLCTAYLGSCR